MTTLLSLTGKNWHMPSGAKLSANTLVSQLLRDRQLEGEEQRTCISPSVFPDITKAVERIRTAISKKEHVAIFGDYDCDGITAAVQLVRFFRRHELEPLVRLPHRVEDGYGLNTSIVEEFLEKKIDLLITVDTGVSSAQEIALAQHGGIDTIVTDHHNIPSELPPAYAFLHPALATSYPEPHPSGAGVAFQLLRALEENKWEEMETDIVLAMIGTIADLVELKGDNRKLVQSGLRALSAIPDGPLTELFKIADVRRDTATSTDIAFRIAPRINASGRMADPQLALQALLDGGEKVEELDHLNRHRQRATEDFVIMAMEELNLEEGNMDVIPPLLYTCNADYPHGIIGLISGKLTELTGKPSIVAAADNGTYTASLRSPESYHITDGLTRCQDLLERFGGHAQAAGCTVKKENWQELCKRLTEDIQTRTQPEDLFPSLSVDAVLTAEDITLSLLEELSALEPYGQGNREPLFLIHNVSIDYARCVGATGAHLQGRIAGNKIVGFGLGKLMPFCNERKDIVCRLSIDTWQGMRKPQIVIVDMRKPQSDSLHVQEENTKEKTESTF